MTRRSELTAERPHVRPMPRGGQHERRRPKEQEEQQVAGGRARQVTLVTPRRRAISTSRPVGTYIQLTEGLDTL